MHTNSLVSKQIKQIPNRSNKMQSVLWFFFFKILISFPCLIRENKSHQLNAAIDCIVLVGTGMQEEPNKAESHAMFSARLFCKQVMVFFLKTPLLIILSMMLLSLQLILHPGFPSFSATFQASSSKALSCFPPDSSRRVGWPVKHSHSKRAGWQHFQKG